MTSTSDRRTLRIAMNGVTGRMGYRQHLLRSILPLRDALLWGLVPFLRTRGYSALPVHFLGKAATFNLLYAFPLLLLGEGDGVVATLALVFGWAFAVWGIGLYWWAGLLYAWQVRRLLATTEPLLREFEDALG